MVPNAPCGVERLHWQHLLHSFHLVPNAPCGVESFRWIFVIGNGF